MSAAPAFAATKGSALFRSQEARPYAQAYWLMKEISRAKAHEMSLENWQQLNRIMDYVGFRFNLITLAGTEFAPKPWRGRPESFR
jgi:hypothetical protein